MQSKYQSNIKAMMNNFKAEEAKENRSRNVRKTKPSNDLNKEKEKLK